jgi:hypothetical protein
MVHDQGVSHIAEGLKANSSLREIDLSMNNIGDLGAETLADLLRINKTLQSLHVSQTYLGIAGHGIGHDGVAAIGVSKPTLHHHHHHHHHHLVQCKTPIV